ncbi:MAG TPA: hypothetical protein VFS61_11630, partial [Anaerolineales bacterium]|nr:hypothetical protein [Anaerolineales bacterium]
PALCISPFRIIAGLCQNRKIINRVETGCKGETGLFLNLIVLGITSIPREEFEIVSFLQARVLEGGGSVVFRRVTVHRLPRACGDDRVPSAEESALL